MTCLSQACSDDREPEAPQRADTAASTSPPTARMDSQTVVLSTAEPQYKYSIRSGVIEYMNSKLRSTQTYYFDNYGAQEAVYLAAGNDTLGVPFDVSIYTGTWRFDYNSRDRSGIAKNQPNRPGPVLGLLPDLNTVHAKVIERKSIAGMLADGIEFPMDGSVRVWHWKGIPLRIEKPLRGGADTLVLEATSFTVDAKVAPERFVVPESISISRLK